MSKQQEELRAKIKHIIESSWFTDNNNTNSPDDDTDAIMQLIEAEASRREREAVQKYEDDLLYTLDDVSNKPWRAIRHIRELFENHRNKDTEWFKEVVADYALLEEFYSNGGRNKIRELMADPAYNVNYPERIAELKSQGERG